MNNTTYPRRRSYSSSRPYSHHEEPKGHPATDAVGELLTQYEGKYSITAEFTKDEESMRLFKRDNSIVIGFICTLYDESGRCLSQGRGISFIGFQGEKFIQRAILYARNASLIDCAMRASKLSTVFSSDDKERGTDRETGNYYLPPDNKPSDKQISYLKNLIESLPADEQNELLTRLPQMSKSDVSELINNLRN
jgi:hypothetical protein